VACISHAPANDDLLLTSGLDRSAEVSVVLGVDLTIPTDSGGVWEHFDDPVGGGGRAVGTSNARRNGQ